MHRIDSAGAAASPPTPSAAGTPGYWTRGNPGSGVAATTIDPDWLNSVQEELLAILAAAGITPSKTTRNQVLSALNQMHGGGGNLAPTGWQRMPGGLLWQWTNSLIVPATTDVTWTFPVAFTYAVFGVFAQQIAYSSSAETMYAPLTTLTSVVIDNVPGTSTQQAYVMAIGV